MTLRFLLDTNAVSEPLRPRPSRKLLNRLSRYEGEMAIASAVWHELQFGCRRLAAGERRRAIEHYLEEVVAVAFPCLAYDSEAAEWHATERARLAARGKAPAFVDGQIAATAQVHDLTIVTADRSGFRGFKGIRVQSWL